MSAADDRLATGPAPNTPATGLLCGLVSGKKALVCVHSVPAPSALPRPH